MKKTVITYASILAITSLGFAKAPILGDNYKLISGERIEKNITVNDLAGASVFDQYGEEIASVDDFEIDPSSGEISTAYLQIGGVMGIGGQYVTLPFSELTYDKAKARFTVKTTRSELKAHLDQQNRKMEMREKTNEQVDYGNASESEDKLAKMWKSVKNSLGVDDVELAEVEAEVRGDTLYLEGEVNDPELKKKIGESFKSSTELKVVNKIKVKK